MALKWFTFAGKDSRDYFTFINKVKRPYLPPISVPSMVIPNRVGQLSYKRNLIAERTIEIDVTMMANSDADLRLMVRDLAEFLVYTTEQELIFSDELNRKYYARFDNTKTDLDELAYMGEGSISFTCFDPLAYSTVENTLLMATGTHEITITNNGNYKLFPRLRVLPTVDCTFIKWTNVTTGKSITYNATWIALNPLMIDTSTNQVYNDSTKANYIKNIAVDSTFFPLEVGDNLIRIENQNADGTGVNGQARIYWTERFL